MTDRSVSLARWLLFGFPLLISEFRGVGACARMSDNRSPGHERLTTPFLVLVFLPCHIDPIAHPLIALSVFSLPPHPSSQSIQASSPVHTPHARSSFASRHFPFRYPVSRSFDSPSSTHQQPLSLIVRLLAAYLPALFACPRISSDLSNISSTPCSIRPELLFAAKSSPHDASSSWRLYSRGPPIKRSWPNSSSSSIINPHSSNPTTPPWSRSDQVAEQALMNME